jgi:hypothetical protein
MSRKQTNASVLEAIKEDVPPDHGSTVDLEKLAIKLSLRSMTLEEKIRAASKPLYLKRYE